MPQHIRASVIHFLNSLSTLAQVLCLETWITSLAWVCLWTRIPTRRNIWRYEGSGKGKAGHVDVCDRVVYVSFCVWTQAKKKRYTSRTQVRTFLQRFDPKITSELTHHFGSPKLKLTLISLSFLEDFPLRPGYGRQWHHQLRP